MEASVRSWALFEVRIACRPSTTDLATIEIKVRDYLVALLEPQLEGDVEVELIEWSEPAESANAAQ